MHLHLIDITPKQAVSYALVLLYARGLARCVCDNGLRYFTSISVSCHPNYTVDEKFEDIKQSCMSCVHRWKCCGD